MHNNVYAERTKTWQKTTISINMRTDCQAQQCTIKRALSRTTAKYGDRSFAVQGVGPRRVWNSLPVELHAPDISQTVFRNKL